MHKESEDVYINRKKLITILQISYNPVLGVSFGVQNDIYV